MIILRSGMAAVTEPEVRARQVQEESASASTPSDRDTNLALPDRTKLNVMNNEPSDDSAQPDMPAHTACNHHKESRQHIKNCCADPNIHIH